MTPLEIAVWHRRHEGFTLLELMVVLTILAVLVAAAAPSFRDSMLNTRMATVTNELLTDINLARSEAVRRNTRAYLCTSTNGTTCSAGTWAEGRIIFIDENGNNLQDSTERAIRSTGPVDGTTTTITATGDVVTGGIRYVPYRPSGTSTPAGASVVFTICDSRSGADATNKHRIVTINPTGRPVVTQTTC